MDSLTKFGKSKFLELKYAIPNNENYAIFLELLNDTHDKRFNKEDELLISDAFGNMSWIFHKYADPQFHLELIYDEDDDSIAPYNKQPPANRVAMIFLNNLINLQPIPGEKYEVQDSLKYNDCTTLRKYLKSIKKHKKNLEILILKQRGYFIPFNLHKYSITMTATRISKTISQKNGRLYGANLPFCLVKAVILYHKENSFEHIELKRFLFMPSKACSAKLEKLLNSV